MASFRQSNGPCFGPTPPRPKASELDPSMEAALKSLMATTLKQDPSGHSTISCFSDVILDQVSGPSPAVAPAMATVSDLAPSLGTALKSIMTATLIQDPSGSSILRCLTQVMSRSSSLPGCQQALGELEYIQKAKAHLREFIPDTLKIDPDGESIARALERAMTKPPQDGCTDIELDMRIILHGDPSDVGHIVGCFVEAMGKHHGNGIVKDGMTAEELSLRTLKAVLRPYQQAAEDCSAAIDTSSSNDGPITQEELEYLRELIASKGPGSDYTDEDT